MKKTSLVIKLAAIFVTAASISSVIFSQAGTFTEVSALSQRKETYAYNEMVGNCSMISGYDITPEISNNELVTYGFRHGDVSSNTINYFSSFGDNRLGNANSGASFLNWRMSTSLNDGAIILFKAHVKSDISIRRNKIGADWKDNITLSIYKNNELLSSKELSDSDTTAEDFNFDITLDVNDTLYWQIKADTTENRHLSMDSAGADWSTLPTFTVTEWVKKDITTTTYDDMRNNLLTNGEGSDSKVTYKYRVGSLYPNNLSSTPVDLGESGDISITTSSNNLFLEFSALTTSSIVFDWGEAEVKSGNASFRYVIYQSNKAKHKVAYEVNGAATLPSEDLSQKIVLKQNDRLYIEFIRNSNYVMDLFSSFTTTQLTENDDLSSFFPYYSPSDFSNAASITHKELAFETARIAQKAVKMKDGLISLTTGEVTVEEGAKLNKFDTCLYDDGKYLESTEWPTFTLAGPKGTFNSDNEAVVQDYRLQTSVKEGVVYKFAATVNTQLVITHPATNGGWVGDMVYIAGYQSNDVKTVELKKDYVNNANEAENTYSITYNLKAGDTAYYVFGSDMAERRNLNIAPTFTTNTENYDADARNEILGATSVEATLYDTVTGMINNNFEPVVYDEVLSVNLAHGVAKNYEQFKTSSGEGKGTENDAIFVGSGGDSDCGFQRWQFHAGLQNDNAITVFTALKDLYLDINHAAMTLFYNEGASLRYYIVDTDNFTEYKEERYLSKDTPSDFYGYEAHLKAGQSLLLEFTANDPEGYAVASIEWVASANTKEFNEALVNDFTEARALQEYKDSKLQAVDNYVATLNPDDYSISNWAMIESYVLDFKEDVEVATHADEINHLYEETISLIDNVLTLAEEAEILNNARTEALAEADAYMNERKSSFSKDTWNLILDEYNAFVSEIYSLTSVTLINNRLQEFKNFIDAQPVVKGCGGSLIASSAVVSGAALIGTVLLIIKKKKEDK